jgi:uncharacterized OsmC-like protein
MRQTQDDAMATADLVVTPEPIVVEHISAEAYEIHTRGHRTVVDQPLDAGGMDSGPTPTELFVGSLAAGVAYHAGRYLVRHGLTRDGLVVSAEFDMATDRPARVEAIRLRLRTPPGFPWQRRGALHAVASHCTVHNTLAEQPSVAIEIQ